MRDPRTARVPLPDVACALGLSVVMLVAAGGVLMRTPVLSVAGHARPLPALRWVMAAPPAAASAALPAVVRAPATGAAQMAARAPAPVGVLPPATSMPSVARAPPPASGRAAGGHLFDPGGRAQLPAQVLADGVDARSTAQRLFEPRDGQAFEHPDRGLFDRAPTAGSSQSRTQRAVFGRDVQAAQARQAPAVAFNPRLHERPADLAAADGPQAYLAAPIADAPVPGLGGQASAQLRSQQAQRRVRVLACRLPAMAAAWSALDQHLGLLQQAEYRMGHGSSPEERRHTLTHEIGRQYNLARRALWQMDQLLPGCPQEAVG